MLKKLLFVSIAAAASIHGMNHEMLGHWGSGKYKVINFSDGPRAVHGGTICEITCSDLVFTHENDMFFKTSMWHHIERYISVNLITGNYNEWKEYRNQLIWDDLRGHLTGLGGITNDSYQTNASNGCVSLQNSWYYMVNTHDTRTLFCTSMLHSTKNIMLSQTRRQDALFKSWNMFCIQPSCYNATHKTPLYAHPLGTLELSYLENVNTACFSPDGKTLFVFLTNGHILKITPHALTRPTPRLCDTRFRWK